MKINNFRYLLFLNNWPTIGGLLNSDRCTFTFLKGKIVNAGFTQHKNVLVQS